MSLLDPDAQFFAQFPDRRAHIRMPFPRVLVRNKQRAMVWAPECELEFRTLGEHDVLRRRIILWKVPIGNPYRKDKNPQILKIPFLAFADETIADEDAVLLPIIEEIMVDAAKKYEAAS